MEKGLGIYIKLTIVLALSLFFLIAPGAEPQYISTNPAFGADKSNSGLGIFGSGSGNTSSAPKKGDAGLGIFTTPKTSPGRQSGSDGLGNFTKPQPDDGSRPLFQRREANTTPTQDASGSVETNTPKIVTYAGQAEADGRAAELRLSFQGNQVSGKLVVRGVNKPGIHLPTTDISFGPVSLTGVWEADSTTIAAPWTGGDYFDGKLVPGYPTKGNLTVKSAVRNGEKVVYLHRIETSSYGYVFPLKGIVYSPPETAGRDGFFDPVGSWSGACRWSNVPITITVEFSNGKDVVVITEDQDRLSGRWQARDKGVLITWSKESEGKIGLGESVNTVFYGRNCLKIDEKSLSGWIFRDTASSIGKQLPQQKIFSSGDDKGYTNAALGPPAVGYSLPNLSNSIFCGPVEMSWGETRTFSEDPNNPPKGDYYFYRNRGEILSFRGVRLGYVYVTSGLKYEKIGNAAKVTAEAEGQHQVWLRYNCSTVYKDCVTGKNVFGKDVFHFPEGITFSWLVLVGQNEIKKWRGKKADPAKPGLEPSKGNLTLTISGTVKEMASKKGIVGAFVEVSPDSYGQECKTVEDGRFTCTFTKLQSGRKELFVRKPYDKGQGIDPIESVEQDLWPIKKYMFVLGKDTLKSNILVDDIIWMERVRYLKNMDRPETDLSITSK